MSHLRLDSRIPSQNLQRASNEPLAVVGLCALPDEFLLVACGSSGGLRALSLRSAQLSAREPSSLSHVYKVAFDPATYTLLLAMRVRSRTSDMMWLVSLQRGYVAGEWSEVQRLQTDISYNDWLWLGLSFVSDSRALFGGRPLDRLYAFDVSREHRVCAIGAVVLEMRLGNFACTRLGTDWLVAISESGGTCLSVYRLVALRLELLARTTLVDPRWLLFREDLLLVADYNADTSSSAIVPFRVTGARVTRLPELLGRNAHVEVDEWCLSGNRLVVLDLKSNDLLIYTLE